MGRTKDAASTELDDKSPTSPHIARTDQDEIGKILGRKSRMATWVPHGTLFVGLCGRQQTLHDMLRHMVGADGGWPRRPHALHEPRDRRLLLRAGLLGSAGASGGLIRQS